MRVSVSSLEDVAAGDWDALLRDQDYRLSHAWMAYIRTLLGIAPECIRVEDGGTLLGVLPCWTVPEPNLVRFIYDPYRSFLTVNEKLAHTPCPGHLALPSRPEGVSAGDFYPLMICGPLHGNFNRLLIREDIAPEQRAHVTSALLEQARQCAASAGVRTISIPFLQADDAQLVGDINRRTSGAGALLLYVWPDHFMRVGHEQSSAKNARRDRAKFERSGARFVVESGLSARWADFAAGYECHLQRYPHAVSIEWIAAEHCAMSERYQSYTATIVKDGNVLGVVFYYRNQNVLYTRSFSVRYDLEAARSGVYFWLIYTGPPGWAAAQGIERIEYGLSSTRMKMSRGCEPRPTFFALVLEPRMRDLFRTHVVPRCQASMSELYRMCIRRGVRAEMYRAGCQLMGVASEP